MSDLTDRLRRLYITQGTNREALQLMVTTHDEGGWPTATIVIARAELA